MTQREIAEQAGISLATLKRWGQRGCPVHRGLAAVLAWKKKEEIRKYGARGVTENAETASPEGLKARLLRAQAENYEIKNRLGEIEHAVKARELVPLEVVKELMREWWGAITWQLRTQPDRLAARVNPSDVEHARIILEEERAEIFRLAASSIEAKDGNG